MRKIELILGILATLSITYKFLIGNELNPILIISILGLSLFYTYFSFAYFNFIHLNRIFKRSSYQEISNWKIFGTIGLGFGLGLTTLGILWSLMYWPFNNYYSLGIPIILIIGIISTMKFSATKSKSYTRIIKRIIIIGGVGAIFWITPQETLNEMLGIKKNEIVEINEEKK